MCGIAGIISTLAPPDADAVVAMRDALTHRGPDDAGLFRDGGACLGHRRLAVIDPTPAGRQPMTTPDGRFTLVYNGELYNDRQLRDELNPLTPFASACDAETVVVALAAAAREGHPADALPRLRGMYALALWDSVRRTLLLARDPLGIKPLYVHAEPARLAFASEIPALFEAPHISPEPDPVTVSAYLSTVRLTLDGRTLFGGVRTLRPGEWVEFDASGDAITARRGSIPDADPYPGLRGPEPSTQSLRDTIEQSVRLHLRADVPTCSLLSGGLDSTILATLAMRELGRLDTYVSGCPGGEEGDPNDADDFRFARLAADAIRSRHVEAPVSGELFCDRWPDMVRRLGVPLGTPNEVAINEVARTLRADGKVVTLSGEGADELFAGYELPLNAAWSHALETPGDPPDSDGRFALRSTEWMTAEVKAMLFTEDAWNDAEQDALLERSYADLARSAPAPQVDEPEPARRLRTHLHIQRRVNLTGLLGRLDTATMLESVEGRTPLADARVAAAAAAIPIAELYQPSPGPGQPAGAKLALRHAFRDAVPPPILVRPKRSFPLPFQAWLADHAQAMTESRWMASCFRTEALAQIVADPAHHWNLAWPVINLALWARRWWG